MERTVGWGRDIKRYEDACAVSFFVACDKSFFENGGLVEKYTMVTRETLAKMTNCFSGTEEMQQFISQLDEVSKELNFSTMLRDKVDDDSAVILIMKEIVVFTLFCREHLELIHELIRNIDITEITEEEKKNMQGQHDA